MSNSEVRTRGFIYNGMYEQIKQLQKVDPAMAGELAISYFEQVLTREISTENPIIKAMVASMEPIIDRDVSKWQVEKDNKQNQKKKDKKLDEIARMTRLGYSQKEIATKFGVSESTISRRLNTIETEFPELLQIQSDDELQEILKGF